MTRSLLESALKLSKAERILLAERLWDSIVDDDDDVRLPLTKAQVGELDKRLGRLEQTGPRGGPWVDVKARVTKRRKPA